MTSPISGGDGTWQLLFDGLERARSKQLVAKFSQGLHALGITRDKIPNLEEVNRKLRGITGWRGIYVEGLEEGESFYPGLARCEFPIGNFIRDPKDLAYTPAPDVFHDLYGHIPFYADFQYAEFSRKIGNLYNELEKLLSPTTAITALAEARRRIERFFWFSVEFGLVMESGEKRIFGAGIASSHKECDYALSSGPEVRPFSVVSMINQEFDITRLQEILYLMESPEQLYSSLPELKERVMETLC